MVYIIYIGVEQGNDIPLVLESQPNRTEFIHAACDDISNEEGLVDAAALRAKLEASDFIFHDSEELFL